ncbi:CYTH and CHAD domain-containing protein [Nocardia lijiangensis]|uniref:CYTH and CHAD domain-containing protein n=1 Tax=Nocardia lijiangensis TaxID=299618 RepID=UPI0008340ADE|nr:CYTH and CHAD domain-containing protein [Nocardia lijiangensis]
MKDQLERESKWEVDQVFTLPALGDFMPDSRVEETSVELTSTYFDTAERDLLAHNVTLRRREGEDESGWQLKVPHARGRLELLAPLSENLPDELIAVVTGVSLGKQLHAVTEIHTLRNRHRILGPGDELIVEIDDDTVRATPADESADILAWREVEIELGPQTDEVPAALVDSLTEAGARTAEYPSKLSRALPEWSGPAGSDRAAQRAIRDYMTTQIDLIFTGDVELRRGRDPIHDTRVAARRLRSTLRVFGKLLDRPAVGDVENELKWFAGLLGEVRDCDVQRRRLADRIKELPPQLVLGPVAARIETTLLERQLPSRDALAEAMNTPRYLQLLATLQAWRSAPPFGGRIRRRDLVTRAHKAALKADRRLTTALQNQRAESFHRARKAAKRARYAAELHKPVRKSGRAKSKIAYYKTLQRVLGDYNDGRVSSEFLWRTAVSAGTEPGENGFTYGLLYANEMHAADRALERVAAIAAAG